MSDSKDLVQSGASGTSRHVSHELLPRNVADALSSSWTGFPGFLMNSIRRKTDPSLPDLMRRSEEAGVKVNVNVETVFVEDQHPLDLLFDEIQYPLVDVNEVGQLRVAWFEDAADGWFLAAWPTSYKYVYHMLSSLQLTDKRWSWITRRLNLTHGIVRPFLNHNDFEQIGFKLAKHGEVEVGRASGRSATNGSSDTRHWPSSVNQARPNPSDVLSEMESQGYSVRSLMTYTGNILSAHIRRTAGATFYSGSIKVFEQVILGELARAASERRTLLVGRQRTENELRPVRVQVPSAHFARVESGQDLIREVSSLQRVTAAVFHRNPYVHLAVSDDTDGSNFDVMVTETDAIDIYPGYTATPTAFSRLLDHVSDRFAGESVGERIQRSYSLDELSLG